MHVESELQRVQNAFDRLPDASALASGGLRFITTGGLTNAYTGELPQITELQNGVTNFLVRFHQINTRASTLALNEFGPLPIRTLFRQPVEAGDLRDIRRLTYFEGVWIMQTVAPSDLRDAARSQLADFTEGPAGLPGASTVFTYDLLRTGEDVTGQGQYRFLMDSGATTGVNTDTGLRQTMALEIADSDAGGTGRGEFYDEVLAGDILTFFIASRRWYAYSIVGVLTPRTQNTRFWSIMPLTEDTTAGTDDLDTASSPASFRWSRARAAIGGVPGVTGDQVAPDLFITVHAVPSDYTTDPLSWPIEMNGLFFRNNAGPVKILVATIEENAAILSTAEHAGYLYQWLRDGALFAPAVPDPILVPEQQQITTRRWLAIDARDVADGAQNNFSCRVCLA